MLDTEFSIRGGIIIPPRPLAVMRILCAKRAMRRAH